jgi:hypothetical protein
MIKSALTRALADHTKGMDFHTVLNDCIELIRKGRAVKIEVLNTSVKVREGFAEVNGTFHISFFPLDKAVVEKYTIRLSLVVKDVFSNLLIQRQRKDVTITIYIVDEKGPLPDAFFHFYTFDGAEWRKIAMEKYNHLNGTLTFAVSLPLEVTKVRIVMYDMRCIHVERIIDV